MFTSEEGYLATSIPYWSYVQVVPEWLAIEFVIQQSHLHPTTSQESSWNPTARMPADSRKCSTARPMQPAELEQGLTVVGRPAMMPSRSLATSSGSVPGPCKNLQLRPTT
jgi:hypothetical protein